MNDNKHTIPFARRTDLLVVAAILLAIGALWFWLRPTGGPGGIARVDFGTDVPSLEISLAEDVVHDIEGGRLPVQLEVADGRIRFIHSVCPDHTCERQGWLQREGEQAICMPAAVAVTVVE